MEYKTVNIEAGMPTVDQAVRRLTYEIATAKRERCAALKIIHGYGSSGTGGRLRVGLREYLARQKAMGRIRDYIPGEDFSIFNRSVTTAFTLCGALRRDRDLERSNNGVTVIIL